MESQKRKGVLRPWANLEVLRRLRNFEEAERRGGKEVREMKS